MEDLVLFFQFFLIWYNVNIGNVTNYGYVN